MNKPLRTTTVLLAALGGALGGMLIGGCQSDVVPMKPLKRVNVWLPDASAATTMAASTMPTSTMAATPEPASTEQASTTPATTATASTFPATTESAARQSAATESAATQPGQTVVQIIDPNQTARFIYKADYDNIWQQGLHILARTGFRMARLDYRLGVMTTVPLPSSQLPEFFRPQQTTIKNSIENTMHTQQRSVRITISPAPGKPDFYEIAIQVLVERQSNPQEQIGGPIFVEGSGFGRSSVALRSDYVVINGKETESPRWVLVGHDPNLEKKLLKELFNRI